ncbi:MAG: hypothetical protein OEY97_10965 [Nitrospirota bacterium]|nr:hypothetical protein [Nitrospirota bacterium]
MQIVEQNEDRLVLRHGMFWLLPSFAAGTGVMGFVLWMSGSRLGVGSELTWYAALAFGVSLWGLLANRMTRFAFDRREKRLVWSRKGVIPAGGTVDFAQIGDVVLESRSDRKDTVFHRVLLVVGERQGIPLVTGRTRDVYNCIDLLEAVRGTLGMDTMTPLLDKGDTAAALRFGENQYGIERKKLEAWVERRHPAPDPGPACELPGGA